MCIPAGSFSNFLTSDGTERVNKQWEPQVLRFLKKINAQSPWRGVPWSCYFRFPSNPFFKLSSKPLSVIRSLFKQSDQWRLLQACDSQSGGFLEKTSASVQERWRSLTAATCAPASSSASISARDLYCCGDSITISLLGALPARPCMVGLSPRRSAVSLTADELS